jgi:hypothetical protein
MRSFYGKRIIVINKEDFQFLLYPRTLSVTKQGRMEMIRISKSVYICRTESMAEASAVLLKTTALDKKSRVYIPERHAINEIKTLK